MERSLRVTLRVSPSALSETRLHRLWLRLDENLNGTIDAGEARGRASNARRSHCLGAWTDFERAPRAQP